MNDCAGTINRRRVTQHAEHSVYLASSKRRPPYESRDLVSSLRMKGMKTHLRPFSERFIHSLTLPLCVAIYLEVLLGQYLGPSPFAAAIY
jgi:hypothetical protein